MIEDELARMACELRAAESEIGLSIELIENELHRIRSGKTLTQSWVSQIYHSHIKVMDILTRVYNKSVGNN